MAIEQITIYTQAVKWNHEKEFKIEYNTVEHTSTNLAMYITIEKQFVDILGANVSDEKLTVAHIDYLKNLKDTVKAKAHQDLQNLDAQINELLAIEHKEVA